jgi:hypothetical protein
VLVLTPSVAVLAVDDPGLVGVKIQPDLDHSLIDRGPQFLRLSLAPAVHHRIIHVAFESDGRKRPGHPHVECVVEEEVGQHGRDR